MATDTKQGTRRSRVAAAMRESGAKKPKKASEGSETPAAGADAVVSAAGQAAPPRDGHPVSAPPSTRSRRRRSPVAGGTSAAGATPPEAPEAGAAGDQVAPEDVTSAEPITTSASVPTERAESDAAPTADAPVAPAERALASAGVGVTVGEPAVENETGEADDDAPASAASSGPDADAGAETSTRTGAAGGVLEPEPLRVMTFSVHPQVLKAGLTAVISALPTRTTLPVLQNVLIATDGDGHVRLTATDLDTTVTRTVPATVTEAGSALVMGRKLHEITREIPDSCVVDVRLAGDVLNIWCEDTRSRFRLPTLPVDEFPTPPRIWWDVNPITVPGKTLALMIERTAFAASTEETRPILNGVLWQLAQGEMAMVATNGHRLATTRVEGGTHDARPELIVPPRALAIVAKLPAEGETVHVAQSDNHLGFRGEGWEIITRTIEGPYPNYRLVIPKDNDKVLVADKALLTAAVRRMSIVASEQTHRIRFSLGADPHTMRISVESPDLGAAHEDLAVEYDGGELEIGFNAVYMLEVLRTLPAGDVRMTFKAADRAATVVPLEDDSGAETSMLLMPLRLLD
jgi:DNA polymerase-3 subunit beta